MDGSARSCYVAAAGHRGARCGTEQWALAVGSASFLWLRALYTEISAHKPAEILITAPCSRTSASFCARESRLATEETHHPSATCRSHATLVNRLKRICPGVLNGADQWHEAGDELVGCHRLR